MSYYFYIDDMMLPIPPAKMDVRIKGKNKTVNLINEGEVNIIKEAGLTEISFDARLPNKNYPFADYNSSLADSMASSFLGGNSFNFKKASHFLGSLETMKKSQEPIRLVICRMDGFFSMLFDTNMLVTLEDYTIVEDAHNGLDVTCPLKFKQYKPYGTKECEVTKDENGTEHLKVKNQRYSNKKVPKAIKISHERSAWEAVKAAAGGRADIISILKQNGIGNPIRATRGTVIHLA